MASTPSRMQAALRTRASTVSALIPDFPFDYAAYLQAQGAKPLGTVRQEHLGRPILVVGAGVSGLVAAYECMRMGLQPVVVEASGRIGGRMFSTAQGNTPFERGAMRFPVSGKTLMHYFGKVGMLENSEDFPNPGSAAAVSTVVDYQGEKYYFEGDEGKFPRPEKFRSIEERFFNEFLEQAPIHFSEMEKAMSGGAVDQDKIKSIWNAILELGWDNLSFHAAMVEHAKWPSSDINLFGQIGFGTGGWNTDFPNSFLEVLRVLYTGLDVSHQLMRDGAEQLPQRLWAGAAASFGDQQVHWQADETVQKLTRRHLSGRDPLRQEVSLVSRLEDGQFEVSLRDLDSQQDYTLLFDAVVYTPHVRILDKFRYLHGAPERALLSQKQWEAVMYTHYMQSTKIFAATSGPFWKVRDGEGKQRMSITLSDRLNRGTYLVDYGGSSGSYKGSGIFLSYTWNDDSLKFLGGQSPRHNAELCAGLLEQIYPGTDLREQWIGKDPFAQVHWEDEPFYLGAFKMNLPGQYEYQRVLFSQFHDGGNGVVDDGFILAGDDVSWTGGWAEGAVTTALNAVDKLAKKFNAGLVVEGGPLSQWEHLKPIPLADLPPLQQPNEAGLCRFLRRLMNRLCAGLTRGSGRPGH
ncbi:TPA: flavin monoamine oxidase family protein [Pseudomonas putida]